MAGSLSFRELEARERFDPLTLFPDAPFTQASFYGAWQEALGRMVRRFVVERDAEAIAYLQAIRYPLPLRKSYWYVPYGPIVCNELTDELCAFLKEHMSRMLKESRGVFARLDFVPAVTGASGSVTAEKYFRRASRATYRGAYFQPRVEWFLDVQKPDEVLLRDMHKNARYSIHLAERKGVTTKIVNRGFGERLEQFYALMQTTATRDRFHLHPRSYYEAIFKGLERDQNGFLVIASYEGKPLVMNVIITYGSIATLIFSGSSNEHREVASTYLAQWVGIREARLRGMRSYNFGGVSTTELPEKQWQGLTYFKTKFGGGIVRRSDFYDMVAEPFWYQIYALRKRLQRL